MGTAFSHPLQTIQGTISTHGFQPSGGGTGALVLNGEVDELIGIKSDGVFHIRAHGGSGVLRQGANISNPAKPTGQMVYCIWTNTDVTHANDVKYNVDLNTDRLCYMLGDVNLPVPPGVFNSTAIRYGMTPGFIAKYMRFGPNSLIFFDACASDSTDAASFKAACLSSGAGVYLGWTYPVLDSASRDADFFLYDRLLGDNTVPPADNPAKPPLDWASVQAAMATTVKPGTSQTYDTSSTAYYFTNAKLTFTPGSGDLGSIVPSITSTVLDMATQELTLIGIFGKTQGSVMGNVSPGGTGTPLTVKSWASGQIVAQLSTGIKNVRVQVDSRPSNIVSLQPGYMLAGIRPDGSFVVDDRLEIHVNNTAVFVDTLTSGSGPRGPFSFQANAGDMLHVVVQDVAGFYSSCDDVYLTTPGGSKLFWIKAYQVQTPPGSMSITLDDNRPLPP